MNNARNSSIRTNRQVDLGPADWPTCDQERELHCLRHLTDPVKIRRFDSVVNSHELFEKEVVVLYTRGVVGYLAALEALKKAGMLVLEANGVKIKYVG